VADSTLEQPTAFYLGREYDLAQRKVLDQPIQYESRDLTTHGVIVGMTGSGKTGLGITLLEEGALDGIPCIIIDPKGDLTNLLLQFPTLDPKDLLPWINPEDARQKGLPLEAYAEEVARTWRQGLADWGQSPERIARLRASSEWRIYTPGSEAGLPLSILQTFSAPRTPISREALNAKIDATTTALLGLSGIEADPVQSREHILIAQLLLHAWSRKRDLDLPQLIAQIQAPPLRTIGAFDVETFYPEKDRLRLALALNNILAAPSFSTWITGEPLRLADMLHAGDKPRQLIFYIAHLEDAQRLFFLTLLLEEVLNWTRAQPGTNSLRAIVYFDEVFGYLPPHPANPPTKTPLMTLLKQARAFGVGILLATQNPVDLDYKALNNAGTWFVGKLQTENDKARLLEGLEGVAAERGTLTDRGRLEEVISALGNRVFLLHDVHRGKPVLFQSRWALSFLRGPLTREQISTLVAPMKGAPPQAIPLCPHCQAELPTPPPETCPQCGQPPVTTAGTPPPEALNQHEPPLVPPDVAQFYLPVSRAADTTGAELVYQPHLLGFAEVQFTDRRKGIEESRTYRLLARPPLAGQPVDWANASPAGDALAAAPETGATWQPVPEALNTARKLKVLERSLVDYLYRNQKLVLLYNEGLKVAARPEEDAAAFRERCRVLARQEADWAVAAEKPKFIDKFAMLDAQLRQVPTAEAERAAEAARLEKHETSALDRIFQSLNPFRAAPAPPAPPAAPPSNKAAAQRAKVEEARRKLEVNWQTRITAIGEKWRQLAEEQTTIELTPRKTKIRVTQFGLGWVPFWRLPAPHVAPLPGEAVPGDA
jgi:hypothetical protein